MSNNIIDNLLDYLNIEISKLIINGRTSYIKIEFNGNKRVTFAPDELLEKVKLFDIIDSEDSDDETNVNSRKDQKLQPQKKSKSEQSCVESKKCKRVTFAPEVPDDAAFSYHKDIFANQRDISHCSTSITIQNELESRKFVNFFIFIYYIYFLVVYLLGCYTYYTYCKNIYPPVVNTFHPLFKNVNVYEYMFANNSDGIELYIF
jgi:hypothetical protein